MRGPSGRAVGSTGTVPSPSVVSTAAASTSATAKHGSQCAGTCRPGAQIPGR